MLARTARLTPRKEMLWVQEGQRELILPSAEWHRASVHPPTHDNSEELGTNQSSSRGMQMPTSTARAGFHQQAKQRAPQVLALVTAPVTFPLAGAHPDPAHRWSCMLIGKIHFFPELLHFICLLHSREAARLALDAQSFALMWICLTGTQNPERRL